MIIHNVKHKFEFQKRDCWVGFYWKTRMKHSKDLCMLTVHHLWICVIPMFPWHISWQILEDDEKTLESEAQDE